MLPEHISYQQKISGSTDFLHVVIVYCQELLIFVIHIFTIYMAFHCNNYLVITVFHYEA